jgi:serine phosphatase RsbU (regulator of sigma subunit)
LFALTYWLTVLGFVLTAGFWRGEVLLDGDAGTGVADAARGLPLAVITRHLLPCLLIPWTLRESLRPGAVLLGLCAVVLVVDAARGAVSGAVAAASIAGCCLALAPGALVSWLRFSRFRSNFAIQFVSARFRRLEAELAGARRVHESCLPPQVLTGPVRVHYSYEPMRQIGGDLVFVHPPPGAAPAGAVSVVVLDVTGHGIAAALTVNRLVGELERLFAEDSGRAPDAVVSALNRYVGLTMARFDLYATALCVRVDVGAAAVEWASAGHPPAYLRRSGGAVETLGSTAPMLGVFGPGDFDPGPGRLPSAPGDVLLAYTDGASEAVSPGGAQLGTAGVARLFWDVSSDGLPPAAWPSVLLARVATYRDAPPDDDTLLVIVSRPP